jgi:streptogramin lyase
MSTRNESLNESLRAIVQRYGAEVSHDPRRLEALLLDYCGDQKRGVFLLVGAARSGMVDRLLDIRGSSASSTAFVGLQRQMERQMGLSEEAAKSTLESWCWALELPVPAEGPNPLDLPAKRGSIPTSEVAPRLTATTSPPQAAQADRTIEGRITLFPISDKKHEVSIVGVTLASDGAVWASIEGRLKDNRRFNWVGRLQDGKWTWVTNRLPEKIGSMVRGPDGAIWFTGSPLSAGSVGKLEPNGRISEMSLGPSALGDSHWDNLFSCADGTLWIASTQSVGKLEPNGGFTKISLGSSSLGDSRWSLIACSHGTLWMVGGTPSVIVSVGPSGLRRFPMPAGITPCHVAEGPDKALWFTTMWNETSGSKSICRWDSDGELRQYAVPHPGGTVTVADAAAWKIVAGPDGNLWIPEPGRASVWVMSTAGQIVNRITFQQRNGYGQGPGEIVAGPDGALWLAGGMFGLKYIVRVDVHGSQKYFSLGKSTSDRIFTDGTRLWFTATEDIGRSWPPPAVGRID